MLWRELNNRRLVRLSTELGSGWFGRHLRFDSNFRRRMDDWQELRPLPNGIRLAGSIIVVKLSISNIESVYMVVLVFFIHTDHCPQNKQWRFSDRGTDVLLVTSTNPAILVALNGDEIHEGCDGH
jgi:hypothetical protein